MYAARIEAADIAAGSLDAVTLWHVLERLEDPAAAVRRIAGWLRVGRERWFHLDVPRHRTHFTPAGITRLLGGHGLAPVAVHHMLLEHNPYGMWQCAVSRLTREPSYVYNLLKRNAPPASRDQAVSAPALALAPVAAAAELGGGMARRGGTIAVLARRS